MITQKLANELRKQTDVPFMGHRESLMYVAAKELERLAEVNVNLLKAINDLSVTAESTKPGEFSVASHAFLALQGAANKARGL